MLFNSISYVIFFPAVFLLYWLAPRPARRLILLVASYVFYMSWIPVYGLLLLLLTALNYFLGLSIDRFSKRAKPLLVLGLVLNLSTLCFFKYTDFLLGSLADLLRASAPWLALPAHASNIPSFNIILPLGISFFVFEFIHYLSDVYKGSKPIRSPIDFALFAAFFPSQIAGPIKRYQDFMQQLCTDSRFNPALAHQGLLLLLQGLFKKIAISDNLAPIATCGFSAVGSIGTVDAWLASLAFAFQIYFDFSGYTDMGRGSAMLLGYKLPDNFNFPYLASSMSDFWKRWHISLSTWLRDYLYFPLGGGRCSELLKYRNLMLTMLLGGLWHGAAWHFVVWGGFHGSMLVVNHKYDDFAKHRPWLQAFHAGPVGKALAPVLTFLLVLVGWVFFRADTVAQAVQMLQTLCLGFKPSNAVVSMLACSPVLVSLGVYSIYALFSQLEKNKSALLPEAWHQWFVPAAPARAAIYAGVVFAAIGFAPSAPSPFIYFQF